MRPRVRLTVRRPMVAVAIAGFLLGLVVPLERRSASFQSLASAHWSEGFGWASYGHGSSETNPRGAWHWEMFRKYDEATRRPWLPVLPDPPQPE
jgi:hypothetical protein